MNKFCSTVILSDNVTARVSTNTPKMINHIKRAKEKYPEGNTRANRSIFVCGYHKEAFRW